MGREVSVHTTIKEGERVGERKRKGEEKGEQKARRGRNELWRQCSPADHGV